MWYISCNIKLYTICTVKYSWWQANETLYTHRHTNEVDNNQKDSTINFIIQRTGKPLCQTQILKQSLSQDKAFTGMRKRPFDKSNKASTAIKWPFRDSNSVKHDSIF